MKITPQKKIDGASDTSCNADVLKENASQSSLNANDASCEESLIHHVVLEG